MEEDSYSGPVSSSGADNEGVVDLDEGQETAPLEYGEDEPNLVPIFAEHPDGKEFLAKIRDKILERFDREWENQSKYRERFQKDWKMLECELDRKGVGEHELSPHLPILLKNVTRLAFRAESELFGDWSEPIRWAPVGETPEDQQLAEARTKHTNWQLREQIRDFKRQMARALLHFFFAGDVIGHTFYDSFRRRNRHEVLTCDDFLMPTVHVSTEPDLSDVPWMVKILRLHAHEVAFHRGSWFGVEEVLKKKCASWDTEPAGELHESIAQKEGHDLDSKPGDAPYVFLMYEGWEDGLPGQDGTPRYIQAIVDRQTRAVLSLTIHEEAPLQELERYRNQSEELDGFRQARMQHEQATMQARAIAPQLEQMMAMGMPPPPEMEAAAQVPPPPLPPTWLPEPEDGQDEQTWIDEAEPDAPMREPVRLFSRGVAIENLLGNHGIGHGKMQAHYNRVGNTALHQFVNAAAANNIPGWFVEEGMTVDGDKERVAFDPGRLHKVSLPSGKGLDDVIKRIEVPPANEQLLRLAGMADEWGQEAAQSPDVLSGEPGKSGETFRGLAARVEQATKQLTVPTSRFADWLRQLVRNNAWLNAIFMPDEEIVNVLDQRSGKYQLLKVGRSLYEDGSQDCVVTSDLRFVSKRERISEADEIVGMVTAMPPLQQNPYFQYLALRKALEARGAYDMVTALGPPPPPPQFPFGMAPPPMMPPQAGDQQQENALSDGQSEGSVQPGAEEQPPPGQPSQQPEGG